MAGRWLKDALGRHLDRSWEALRGYEGFQEVPRVLFQEALGPQNKRLKSLDNRYKLIEEG